MKHPESSPVPYTNNSGSYRKFIRVSRNWTGELGSGSGPLGDMKIAPEKSIKNK